MDRTRRAALAAAAAVALVALAGCGAFTSPPETELLLVNDDDDDTGHDVTVEVVGDDGDVVLEEQRAVESETDNEFGTVAVSGEHTVAVQNDGSVVVDG